MVLKTIFRIVVLKNAPNASKTKQNLELIITSLKNVHEDFLKSRVHSVFLSDNKISLVIDEKASKNTGYFNIIRYLLNKYEEKLGYYPEIQTKLT